MMSFGSIIDVVPGKYWHNFTAHLEKIDLMMEILEQVSIRGF